MASMISKVLEKFMNLPQEDFTSIIITAISMGELHDDFIDDDKKRLKWRGFNQAELLAQVISQELNIPVNNAMVTRIVTGICQVITFFINK
jgi:hypothetical protein